MKQIFLVAISLLFTSLVNAQKKIPKTIDFEYIQYPREVLKESKYSNEVTLSFSPEAEYEEALKIYKEKKAEADARYESDMKKYRQAGFLIGIKKPVREVIPEPIKRTTHDPVLLAKEYLVIKGFKNSNHQDGETINVKATLRNSTFEEGGIFSRKVFGQDAKIETKYYKSYKYKNPVHLQVTNNTGDVLLDELVGGEASTYNSNNYNNKSGAAGDQYLTPSNKVDLEHKAVHENMKKIYQLLNANFGYMTQMNRSVIYLFSHKKHQYDDYVTAYEKYSIGVKKLGDIDLEEDAFSYINQAIVIWKNALSKSDLKNKKARINREVTILTQFMLTEAYIWTNQFDEADLLLTKLSIGKLSKKEQDTMNSLQNMANYRRKMIKAYHKSKK